MPTAHPIPPSNGEASRQPVGKVAAWTTVLLLPLLLLAACGMFDSVKVAEAEVEAFHSRYNDGRHREIYLQADAILQQTASEAGFMASIQAIHRKLGNLVEATRTDFQAGWDSSIGQYVSLTYQSRFTQGEGVEEFVWHVDGGAAKLVRYNISSSALILR